MNLKVNKQFFSKNLLLNTDQAMAFERILQNKLDTFCPEKTMKISSQDKPWIDKELKTIARQKGV